MKNARSRDGSHAGYACGAVLLNVLCGARKAARRLRGFNGRSEFVVQRFPTVRSARVSRNGEDEAKAVRTFRLRFHFVQQLTQSV
jgi:hypothetical protein